MTWSSRASSPGVDDRVAECVGLDVQRGGQTGGRKDGEVAGVVVRRCWRSDTRPRVLVSRAMAPDAAPCRALEEHVLEHVGDAGPAVRLVEETRLHVSDHRNHRRGVVRLHQQGEAVREDLADNALGPQR